MPMRLSVKPRMNTNTASRQPRARISTPRGIPRRHRHIPPRDWAPTRTPRQGHVVHIRRSTSLPRGRFASSSSAFAGAEGGDAGGGEAAAEAHYDGETEQLAEAHDDGDRRGHGHVVVLERLLVSGDGDRARVARGLADE